MTSQTPLKYKVAINCLVYNQEPYLRDCLEGFVMQQTDFPFVAIVHDDASTDHSADIIRDYAGKYPDLIHPIYEMENQWSKHDGSLERIMSDAIAATGVKYIAMCEGDDYWTDPYKLQKQVDFLERHEDCSCCSHNALKLDTKTQSIELFNKTFVHKHDYTLEEFIKRDWFTPTQSLVYRQSAYTEFDDNPSFRHGDYSILVNILLGKDSYIHYDNDIMAVYRNGGVGHADTKAVDFIDDFIYMLQYYKEKSNHRCDAVFNQLIEHERIRRRMFVDYERDKKRSLSWYTYIGHFLSRVFAKIVNVNVKCIHVTKSVDYPNLEPVEELK